MVDLAITVAEVLPGSTGSFETLIAGEAIDAGEVCYKKAADGKAWLADCDDSVATAVIRGVAVGSAGAGQKVTLQKTGTLTTGATAAATVGEIYMLSDTPGKIAPEADISTQNDYVSILGVASAAATIDLGINNTGIQIP